MNKIEKAIIVAAGIGRRMRPITCETPKPLVSVNGKRMIEGIIETLQKCNISDIIIVVGYLHDRFDYLIEKYNVKLIYNPDYETANNISSLYYARFELSACIILDGDQIINDIKIIENRIEHSGYACWYIDSDSSEWIMQLSDDGYVESCNRNGGCNGWELKSLSYWTEEDAAKLAKYITVEYEKGNKQIYWDDVAMFLYRDDFKLYGHRISKDSITEIDSIDELISIDKNYAKTKEKI